jgi:hypothetical protein
MQDATASRTALLTEPEALAPTRKEKGKKAVRRAARREIRKGEALTVFHCEAGNIRARTQEITRSQDNRREHQPSPSGEWQVLLDHNLKYRCFISNFLPFGLISFQDCWHLSVLSVRKETNVEH